MEDNVVRVDFRSKPEPVEDVAEQFAAALRGFIVGARQEAQQRAAIAPYLPELDRLAEMDTEAVKRLWDAYDGTNDPGGFDGVSIHIDLNRRGEGIYCAV